MDMVDAQERKFKLSLTLTDHNGFAGAHAVLALMKDAADDLPLLVVEAGGFPTDEEGAGELSDMLRDAADAIDDHLDRKRTHTDTSTLETVDTVNTKPKRPAFNPQPRGAH